MGEINWGSLLHWGAGLFTLETTSLRCSRQIWLSFISLDKVVKRENVRGRWNLEMDGNIIISFYGLPSFSLTSHSYAKWQRLLVFHVKTSMFQIVLISSMLDQGGRSCETSWPAVAKRSLHSSLVSKKSGSSPKRRSNFVAIYALFERLLKSLQ